MKKNERRAFSFDRNLELLVVRWNVNSIVTAMTNNFGLLPVVQEKHYNKKERKEISISQSNVDTINSYMDRVNLHANGIANWVFNMRRPFIKV